MRPLEHQILKHLYCNYSLKRDYFETVGQESVDVADALYLSGEVVSHVQLEMCTAIFSKLTSWEISQLISQLIGLNKQINRLTLIRH